MGTGYYKCEIGTDNRNKNNQFQHLPGIVLFIDLEARDSEKVPSSTKRQMRRVHSLHVHIHASALFPDALISMYLKMN